MKIATPRMVGDENERMPADALSDLARVSTATSDGERGSAERAASVPRARLTEWLAVRAMFIIAVSAVLIISLLGIPLHLNQDSWLALVAGRLVAAHGVPQHDYFASMTQGVRWVDQQWLAQLLMYEAQRIGGLQLMTVLYVLITAVAFGAAIAAARALGGEDLHVLMAALPGAFFYLATAVSIRTQGLAYPLFVGTVWLLASEVRRPVRARRVYWVFPILVLWGNLHGSASLGVGLAVLYGVALIVGELRREGRSGLVDGRAWAFIVISPLTLLATPYGLGMIHYYSSTLLNSQFSRIVTEWKPITSIPILAVPLFALIALTGAAIGRTVQRTRFANHSTADGFWDAPLLPPLFDVLTLTALALGAVMAVRNVTWFGLALMMLLPAIITKVGAGEPAPLRRARLNRILAVAAMLLAALLAVVVLARPTSWFTPSYPAKAIPTLRALVARDPHAKILADVRYADWLIWNDPRLFSGRVAYDTSFELLTKPQLTAIGDLAANTRNARNLVDDYRIWMLYPSNRSLNRRLLHRPRVRLVSRSREVIIALHGSKARE